MSLYYLVYISAATRLMEDGDLSALLAQSRRNNTRNNITGMLLYKDGGFMQALEGEEDDVMRLHDKISSDSRHKNILTLVTGKLEKRHFGEWTMAFHNPKAEDRIGREGFSSFLNEPFNVDCFGEHPHHALKLLLSFKRTNDKR